MVQRGASPQHVTMRPPPTAIALAAGPRTRYLPEVTSDASIHLIDSLRPCLEDRYDLERELGGGGMSRVFVAVERELNRRVVIKVLSPELGQAVNVDRFKLEIATSATLQHPQIIPVYGAGACGDLLYFVMPFVSGESLRAHLNRVGTLPAQEVTRILTLLARGLAYAHREGVVHRDIKPENILLAQGEPMLADFGIAKVIRQGNATSGLTSAGMSIGTVVYMAPEQVVADPATDGRADVYSLAALGFELLSGRPSFTGSPQQVMSAHVVSPPAEIASLVPGLPAGLARCIMLGLTKDAADRPNADTFAALLSEAPEATDSARSRRATSRPVLIGLAAVAVAAMFILRPRSDNAVNSSPKTDAPAHPGGSVAAGVAVLPFESIGAQGQDQYFAEGLAAEVMTAIAQVPGLRVASRSTVRAFEDSTLTPSELGRRLGVKALVEGSVQRAGARLRITARLIDVVDGSALWSEHYDRTMADVFTTETEISQAIVSALAPRLGISRPMARSTSGTSNTDAYDLFLRAQFSLDARDLRSAIDLFRRALDRDPRFARAQAGIAEANALLPLYGGATHVSLSRQIRVAADSALLLDSTLASPHTALGFLAKGTGEWQTAELEFTRAATLQPSDGSALQNLGELLFTLGRFDESGRALTRAAALEPMNAGLVGEFAYALMLAGHIDSASRTIDRALKVDGRNPYLHYTKGVIAERAGDPAAAIAPLRVAIDRTPLPFFLGVLARAQLLSGDAAAAQLTRKRLQSMRPAAGTTLALVIADLGTAAPEELVAGLSRAVDEHDAVMYLLPMRLWWFDRVRDSAGFAALVKRLGLPEGARTAMPPRSR